MRIQGTKPTTVDQISCMETGAKPLSPAPEGGEENGAQRITR